MTTANYHISHEVDGWVIKHDGVVRPPYEMPDAAFEAALAAASLSLRDRHDVVVSLSHHGSSRETNVMEKASVPNIHD